MVKFAQKRGATCERRGAGEAPWYHQVSGSPDGAIRQNQNADADPSAAISHSDEKAFCKSTRGLHHEPYD